MGKMSAKLLLVAVLGLHLWVQCCVADIDYAQALNLSILYFEAQRSGKLPTDQRVTWRGDSALEDGKYAGVDLTGGYYDAGDNVKFGLPLAFAMTMLSWGVSEGAEWLKSKDSYNSAREAVKWGTNYLIKTHIAPTELYVQVGEGQSDHDCWQRPEDMTTPRNAYKIDQSNPGSDVAAETAAALAAASLVFGDDKGYSTSLLNHARQLFDFARNHRGLYHKSVTSAGAFYPSSGDDDELAWAAVWLYQATGEQEYLDAILLNGNGGVRTMFSWDDKWVGVQALVSKLVTTYKVPGKAPWTDFKGNAEHFFCNMLQKAGQYNIKMTPAGKLWWNEWNDFQYTASSSLALIMHAEYHIIANASLICGDAYISPDEMMRFVKNQVDYILGANPKEMSYMVGFGTNYPKKVHHRGGSIVSFKKDPSPVTCKGGFETWYNKDAPDPNVVNGAVVGGPGIDDGYDDSRSNFKQAEPAMVNTAPLVGVLARLTKFTK